MFRHWVQKLSFDVCLAQTRSFAFSFLCMTHYQQKGVKFCICYVTAWCSDAGQLRLCQLDRSWD